MEAGWAPEPDCALEQEPRLSLTKIATQFLDCPASGLVATLTIWSSIYFLVLQIGEELLQVSELVFTFLRSVFGLTQEKN